jgi:hypothetical protein
MMSLFRSISWLRRIVIACLAFSVEATGRCEDKPVEAAKAADVHKAGEGRWDVIAECQMVVVPQKLVWPFIPDLSDEEKIEGAWAKLQQMIERGEATLVSTLTAHGGSGERIVAESIEEVRYATEYTPPQLPEKIPGRKAEELLKKWPYVGITPTAFETRNVGTTLELTATVSGDGQWISLQAAPTHVRFLRFVKIDGGILSSGERLSVEQPYFSSLKDTLSLQIHPGQRVLAGVHKIPGEESNMELFFLRLRAHWTGHPK